MITKEYVLQAQKRLIPTADEASTIVSRETYVPTQNRTMYTVSTILLARMPFELHSHSDVDEDQYMKTIEPIICTKWELAQQRTIRDRTNFDEKPISYYKEYLKRLHNLQ